MYSQSGTTSPRHPVEQGVRDMRSIFPDGATQHECLRIPLDVAEDVLGCRYDGSFGHEQVLRVTLATDPGCPAWVRVRESRPTFHDQHAVILLGPAVEQQEDDQPAATVPDSNETFAAGVAYGLRYAVRELDDGGVAEIERQAVVMEARAEGRTRAEVSPITSPVPSAGCAAVVDDLEGTLRRCRQMLAFAAQALTDHDSSSDAWIEGAELGLSIILEDVHDAIGDAIEQAQEGRGRRAGGAV